jgi:DNA-binding MarR family transcriptional regulator
VIRGPEKWNVRRIAQSLSAPISTISSALDRLEKRGLVARRRRPGDRRVVHIELTAAGHRLIAKIRGQQVEVCVRTDRTPYPRSHSSITSTGRKAQGPEKCCPFTSGMPVHWLGAALFHLGKNTIAELWVLGDLAALDALLKKNYESTH